MVASLDSDIKIKMGKLKAAMADAGDGKAIKRTVSARLRAIAKPTEAKMKSRVLALPSKGHPGASMRQAIARQTRAATRWGGKSGGVSIIQKGRSMPRDFAMAGRAFNREDGWDPKTLGGIVEHQRMKPAQWFDGATEGIKPQAQAEIVRALDDAAAMIAARAR